MMKQKLTNEQKLYKRKITKPNFAYVALGYVWKALFMKKYNLHYEFKYDFRKEKGPYVFISNHQSRLDYIFCGLPLLPNKFNFVAGYNEFYRSHLKGVFGLLKVIPKKNFVPDTYTIKEVTRVLKNGGKVTLFPEGMSSIGGMNQPVAIGTGKFIKHFKVPVYYSVIKGGYLTAPKYTLDERPGRVEVTFDRMFTPEEIDELSPEEIEKIINEKLNHDDYKWNKEKRYKYKNSGNLAEHLEDLLFWCPKCGKEFTMRGQGNEFKCLNCGNGVTIDDTYRMTPLSDECVVFDTQSEWFNKQREYVKNEILKDDGYSVSCAVKLGTLPDYGDVKDLNTSIITGEGKVTIDKNGFTYDGTNNGEAFSFHIDGKDLPTYGMCTDVTRFYTFYKGKFMEFYPEFNCVEKIFMVTEEFHKLHGGRWGKTFSDKQ